MRAALAAALFIVAAGSDLFGAGDPCRFLSMTTGFITVGASGYSAEGRVVCYNEYTNQFKGEFAARTWVVNETYGVIMSEDTCPACYVDVWNGYTSG